MNEDFSDGFNLCWLELSAASGKIVKQNGNLINFAKFLKEAFLLKLLGIINLGTLDGAGGCHGVFSSKLLLVLHSSILKEREVGEKCFY